MMRYPRWQHADCALEANAVGGVHEPVIANGKGLPLKIILINRLDLH